MKRKRLRTIINVLSFIAILGMTVSFLFWLKRAERALAIPLGSSARASESGREEGREKLRLPSIIRETARSSADPRVTEDLLWAVLRVESSGDNEAERFEPKVYLRILERCKDPGCVRDAEKLATSHGYMQILGETARLYGVTVPELKKPGEAIPLAGLMLEKCIRHEDDVRLGVACYNQGFRKNRKRPFSRGALRHAAKVMKEREKVKLIMSKWKRGDDESSVQYQG